MTPEQELINVLNQSFPDHYTIDETIAVSFLGDVTTAGLLGDFTTTVMSESQQLSGEGAITYEYNSVDLRGSLSLDLDYKLLSDALYYRVSNVSVLGKLSTLLPAEITSVPSTWFMARLNDLQREIAWKLISSTNGIDTAITDSVTALMNSYGTNMLEVSQELAMLASELSPETLFHVSKLYQVRDNEQRYNVSVNTRELFKALDKTFANDPDFQSDREMLMELMYNTNVGMRITVNTDTGNLINMRMITLIRNPWHSPDADTPHLIIIGAKADMIDPLTPDMSTPSNAINLGSL